MSADNWTICPACKARVDRLNQARINAPGQAYGKVSEYIYEKLLDAAKNLLKYDESLREDYELFIDKDGKFYVSYSGCCDCGFHFKFKHEEKVKF